jgi:hypothetical protein
MIGRAPVVFGSWLLDSDAADDNMMIACLANKGFRRPLRGARRIHINRIIKFSHTPIIEELRLLSILVQVRQGEPGVNLGF